MLVRGARAAVAAILVFGCPHPERATDKPSGDCNDIETASRDPNEGPVLPSDHPLRATHPMVDASAQTWAPGVGCRTDVPPCGRAPHLQECCIFGIQGHAGTVLMRTFRTRDGFVVTIGRQVYSVRRGVFRWVSWADGRVRAATADAGTLCVVDDHSGDREGGGHIICGREQRTESIRLEDDAVPTRMDLRGSRLMWFSERTCSFEEVRLGRGNRSPSVSVGACRKGAHDPVVPTPAFTAEASYWAVPMADGIDVWRWDEQSLRKLARVPTRPHASTAGQDALVVANGHLVIVLFEPADRWNMARVRLAAVPLDRPRSVVDVAVKETNGESNSVVWIPGDGLYWWRPQLSVCFIEKISSSATPRCWVPQIADTPIALQNCWGRACLVTSGGLYGIAASRDPS